MATFTSHSPADTLALGEEWGRAAGAGWLIGLSGDLGAGKTQLVKGIARGLGINTRIQSPTFGLVNEYDTGRLPLAHLDLYRLESVAAIETAGLAEYFRAPRGIVIVEWCERWPDFDQPSAWAHGRTRLRRVHLELIDELSRRIRYEDFGG